MDLVQTVSDLHATLQPWRSADETIALVPTMGNLHEGHLRLVEKARELSECVVASVFVNPLQFAPNEDFDRYPRTMASDRAMLERAGVQLLFAPSVEEMYPGGYPPATGITVAGALGEILCASFRPGHFSGVATVVNILFNRVAPQIALFGEKDYQQLAVIRQMTADLGLPIRIVGVPTLREPDGLAMSSRNQYLSRQERKRASGLYACLEWVGQQLAGGQTDFDSLSQDGQARLARAGFNPQYLAIRATDLGEPTAATTVFVVLAAAFMGSTRLIDNLTVSLSGGSTVP